jgi:uncharacterized protein YigE (DUF2233 family)
VAASLAALVLWLAPALAAAVECAQTPFHDVRFTVCRVDLRTDRLQLFLKDESGKPYNSFQRLAESLARGNQRLVFAMNAGMYREDFSPVGLFISDGRQVHRLNRASGYGNFYMKPNGVFALFADGARIIETSDYYALQEMPLFATQSGPLLLWEGRVSPTLNPQGISRLIRNGVGVVSASQVVFVISEDPVSFYDFAVMFRDLLRCTDALYLDGNVSSLYAPNLARDDERVPLGPIVGVTVPLAR